MTSPTSWTGELRRIAGRKAPPYNEPPAVIGKRKFVVGAVLLIGAALLGYSLSRPPGDETFIWLTLALAGVWAAGAFLSGPLHMGHIYFRGRNHRPVITGTAIGLGLGAIFVLGGLVVREIPGINDYVRDVLQYSKAGPLYLIVFITVINGLAEEMFFRGPVYTALLKHHPVVASTVLYVIATAATTGNPMLGFAAIILGSVCALLRRATGGVLAPMLTHFFWGLVMVLALPPMFGV
ncbi:MAG: lysostaphin resistance A-like protein [Microbacteriaceae bacterium]